MTQFDSPLGLAIRRWCAPVLGLEPHADADTYWRRRSELAPDELAALMLRAAGISRWIVDTGYQGDLITTPERLTELSGCPSSSILRLERLAEELLETGTSPDAFPDAFRSALQDAADSPETVGTKTIAAYRTAFDIDWSRPSDAEVIEHARELAERREPLRLDSPVLVAFGLHEAAAGGLPVGLGARDTLGGAIPVDEDFEAVFAGVAGPGNEGLDPRHRPLRDPVIDRCRLLFPSSSGG